MQDESRIEFGLLHKFHSFFFIFLLNFYKIISHITKFFVYFTEFFWMEKYRFFLKILRIFRFFFLEYGLKTHSFIAKSTN